MRTNSEPLAGDVLIQNQYGQDSRRPIPLNSATVTNDSALASDVADARGRSHAIAAFMSFSKFSGGYGPKGLLEIDKLRLTTMHDYFVDR